MALQFSEALRNLIANQPEIAGGTSPTLEIRTGSVPATCATADSGTAVAILTLPSDWMSAASAGVAAQSGTWSDASANATGTAAHFRFKTSGAVVFMQGTVTATGGGGDITVDNTSFASGQAFSITGFTLTAPGA